MSLDQNKPSTSIDASQHDCYHECQESGTKDKNAQPQNQTALQPQAQVVSPETHTRKFLELLGYKAGESLYLRVIHPDQSAESKKKNPPKNLTIADWANVTPTIRTYQKRGYDCYLIVNGGAHSDAGVQFGRAIFYEHDDGRSKAAQKIMWQQLGLPEPTLQIDTGGKSVHSYWVFDQPIAVEIWRQIQSDFLEFSDGDRSIKNPSRIMRMPGTRHMKSGGINTALIIGGGEKRYSFEDLRKLIPVTPPAGNKPSQKTTKSPSNVTPPNADTPQPETPSGKPIPLIQCLSSSDRELIKKGVAEGGRNDAGAKVARGLLGADRRLTELGIPVEGEPSQLLKQYGNRCNPPLEEDELNTILNSASAANPESTLSDEYLKNCLKSWYKNQIRKGEFTQKAIPEPVTAFLRKTKNALLDPKNPDAQYAGVCLDLGLPPEDCVTDRAFDTWAFHQLFSGAEEYRVIDSAFYKWSVIEHYWKHQTDNLINCLLADAGDRAFLLVFKDEERGWIFKKPYGANRFKESAFKYCRSRLERPEPLPTNTHLLGFRNCVVDLRTGQQIPHSKDLFLTNIVPLDYEPGKECPEVFRSFIVESFGEDMLEPIRAFTSMFLDSTAPYGRFPHLIGQSGGGKGTLGRFWSSLFGEEGSSSAAHFRDIATPEGRHQFLTGKRIFAFPDMGGFAEGVRAFYELVDNGALSGRALFNPVAYSKQWYIRFWLASVNHLQIENSGDGWARRAYPLAVRNRTVKPDPHLRMKLEACKAEVISWALAMPREDRDRILLSPPESERAKNLARDAALHGDSTRSFVDLTLRPSPEAGYIPSHLLHSWYVAYCKEHGYTPLGMSKFVSHLKTVLPRNFQERSWKPQVNGERDRIQSHWSYLAPLQGVYKSQQKEAEDYLGDLIPKENLLWTCLKSKCEEGGLADFEDFWQPKSPETLPSLGVRPVHPPFDGKNEPGHPETQSLTGCPSCPSVPTKGVREEMEKKNPAVGGDPRPQKLPIFSTSNLGEDKLDRADTRTQQGFQPVRPPFDRKKDPGQGGHPDTARVSASEASQKPEDKGQTNDGYIRDSADDDAAADTPLPSYTHPINHSQVLEDDRPLSDRASNSGFKEGDKVRIRGVAHTEPFYVISYVDSQTYVVGSDLMAIIQPIDRIVKVKNLELYDESRDYSGGLKPGDRVIRTDGKNSLPYYVIKGLGVDSVTLDMCKDTVKLDQIAPYVPEVAPEVVPLPW